MRLLALLSLFSIFLFFFSFSLLTKNLDFKENYIYTIEEGESLESIKANFKDLDINFPFIIDLYFYISGADKSLRKGEYLLTKDSDLFSISRKLAKGKVFYRSFYIPEGSIVSDFLTNKEQNSFCNFKGIKECQLEGMFHPNTYFYETGENLNNILNESFNAQLAFAADQFERLNDKKFIKSYYDLITVASILEKESCANERSLISGVIYNRLNRRMKLQIDSTVIYGIKNFNGNLTRKDLKTNTPFNSYINFGLPPKPISMPSKLSLIAAANPKKSEYLYFVSNGKCSHKFSVNYSDHLEAIKKYQLNK